MSAKQMGLGVTLITLAFFLFACPGWGATLTIADGSLPFGTVNTATAGNQPDDPSNSSTTYSITTDKDNMKVTAQSGSALEGGVTLEVEVAAPGGGGTSQGFVDISDGSVHDVVTGIPTGIDESGLSVIFRLSITVDAGILNSSREVTLTVTT